MMARKSFSNALRLFLCVGMFLWPVRGAAGQGPQEHPLPLRAFSPTSGCPVVQNTPSFTLVYGLVSVDGSQALPGSVVAARSPRGDVVGCFEITIAGLYGLMYVYGEDDSVSPPIPGMREGETVVFTVDGVAAEATPALAWSNDRQFHQVDLNATTPVISADLTIAINDIPDPVIAGNNLTYVISVHNDGPDPATSVIVSDALPSPASLVSAIPSQGNCSGTTVIACDLGTLGLQDTESVIVTVHVDPSTRNILANTASVAGTETDPNTGNNSATATTSVNSLIDLSIQKSHSSPPIIAGGLLTYTLDIFNQGPSLASGIVVTDALPAEVSLIQAIPSQGSGCNQVSGLVTCDIDSLSPLGSGQVTILVEIPPDVRGTITNTAGISGVEVEITLENNLATLSTTIDAEVDLEIIKTDDPDPVIAGESLTYTLSVFNLGISNASEVMLTDTLPSGVAFVSAAASQGAGCSEIDSVVSCDLGLLTPQANAQVTISVTVDPTTRGILQNTATVTSAESDPNQSNNESTTITTVNAEADLAITKVADPDPVIAGETLTYTIRVSNNGPSTATGVVVSDTLPSAVSLVSATPSQGNCSGMSEIVCDLDSLDVSASATITIRVTVNPTARDALLNKVLVAGLQHDPQPGNDAATVATAVDSLVDLAIAISDDPDSVIAGEVFTTTIQVNNIGPSTATEVDVSGILPAGITLSSVTPSQGICSVPGAILCNLGSVNPGALVEIEVVISVDPSTRGALSFSAEVAGDEAESSYDNNRATSDTVVDARIDLSVAVMDQSDPVEAGSILTYTLSISNQGPSMANEVTLTDMLPVQVDFLDAQASQGTGCQFASGKLVCSLGSLSPGAFAQVIVRVSVKPTYQAIQIANWVRVAAVEQDVNSANDVDLETTQVTPLLLRLYLPFLHRK